MDTALFYRFIFSRLYFRCFFFACGYFSVSIPPYCMIRIYSLISPTPPCTLPLGGNKEALSLFHHNAPTPAPPKYLRNHLLPEWEWENLLLFHCVARGSARLPELCASIRNYFTSSTWITTDIKMIMKFFFRFSRAPGTPFHAAFCCTMNAVYNIYRVQSTAQTRQLWVFQADREWSWNLEAQWKGYSAVHWKYLRVCNKNWKAWMSFSQLLIKFFLIWPFHIDFSF